MARRTLRTNLLFKSVQQLLGADAQIRDVAMLFTRHRWFLPYSIVAAIAVFVVASATGVAGLGSRIVLGLCGLAIAGMATTNYWVLADSGNALVLCRSSRIRQYATGVVERLPRDTPLEMFGSTVITSDWKIRGVVYTTTKRWESSLREMAMGD